MSIIDATTEILHDLIGWGNHNLTRSCVVSSAIVLQSGQCLNGNGNTITFRDGGSLSLAPSTGGAGEACVRDVRLLGTGQPVGLTINADKFRVAGVTVGQADAFGPNRANYIHDFGTGVLVDVATPITGPAELVGLNVFNYSGIGVHVKRGNDVRITSGRSMSGITSGVTPMCPLLIEAGGGACIVDDWHSWGNHQFGDLIFADGVNVVNCQHECSPTVQLIVSGSDVNIDGGRVFLSPDAVDAWPGAEGVWFGLNDVRLAKIQGAGLPSPLSGGWGKGIQVRGLKIGRTMPKMQSFASCVGARVAVSIQESQIGMFVPVGTTVMCDGELNGVALDVKDAQGNAAAVLVKKAAVNPTPSP